MIRLKLYPIVVVAILFTALFGAGPGQASPLRQGQAAPIRLKAATFTPGRGEAPAIPSGLDAPVTAKGQRGYYLVQFRGPVEQAWKDQIAAAGVDLIEYIPEYAFKVRMTSDVAQKVAGLANVAWIGPFHPAYKLDTDLKRDGTQLYQVRVERGADAGLVAAQVAQTGAQLIRRDGQLLVIAADSAQVDALARVADVAWVQNFALHKKHNKYGAGQIMGANTANANGYDGEGQIVAVADTGLGGGTDTTAHTDIPQPRVANIFDWAASDASFCYDAFPDGAKDVDSGHGTHVAGSVLSDGNSNPEGKGTAPKARLVFQAVEDYADMFGACSSNPDGYYLLGIPDDLKQLFQQAYNAGARVHSNSWGSDVKGDYTLDSANADSFVWTNRDMLISFSAGNAGADTNANGVVDNDSIGSPATAKNVLTVGASENDRQGHYECDTSLTYTSHDTTYQNGQTCQSMGGQNLLGTPRQRWGFTANPIADDPTAGNAEQMAAFSSRGPTDDGRIKPDVVAPGTWILSTYSNMHQEGYGDPVNPRNGAHQSDGWGIPRDVNYKYFGGTSMSNPLTAGAAAVVRDYYQSSPRNHNASAALVKATLINSAVDLADENNDGANDNDFPIPNVHEGWGRVNVAAATDNTALFVDNTAGLGTGASASHTYDAPGGQPLKITLVWSDAPSTETAALNLVNNLNLVVSGPGGVSYKGNVFSGGWSQTGGSADTVNNVENVYVQAAAAGTWTVQVSGANVPSGPQPFAIVVRGATTAPPPPPPAAPNNLAATTASSSQINLTWTDNADNETGFKIERCQGATCSNFGEIASVGANVTSYPNTGLSPATTYTYRVRATNAGGDSGYSNTASATTSGGPSNTGLKSPSTNAAQTGGDGNGFQTSPASAHTDGGTLAVDTNSGSNSNTSCTNSGKDKHRYYDYGFAIPSGAAINGIEVRLDARADSTSGSPKICVQLSWNGGTSWTTAKSTPTLSTSEATYMLGSATDTWGRTWNSTNDFTDANFRVRIINVASSTSRDFSLDWVAVRVTHQ